MFKQAHSPKYKEICKYNRSFKTLRGLGWVNLKECALSIHKKTGKSAAVLFHLGLALPCARNQNFIFTGFQFIFCHLGQEVKEFYEILARFYYHFITHPSNRRRNPKFQNHTAVESVK